MNPSRDEFLSEEDLDLRNLSEKELDAYWTLWLRQAQTTNEMDVNVYSHGVFTGDGVRFPPDAKLKPAPSSISIAAERAGNDTHGSS